MSSVKLLGLNISIDLKWTCHMSQSSSKVSAWLYYLKQLKRASIATKEIINFSSTWVRPVIESACPVFHNSLPSYTSQMSLRACRKAPWELLILSHARTYQEALGLASLQTLFERRGQVQTVKLSQNISNNPDLANYTVFFFLPGSNKHSLNLKNNRRLDNSLSICKTDRLKSFFSSSFFTEIVYRPCDFIKWFLWMYILAWLKCLYSFVKFYLIQL